MQKKSVYSIVLSDRVVEQVDALAYENGMSRSAMINHILAEQLSLTTPEQQMRSILSAAEELLRQRRHAAASAHPRGRDARCEGAGALQIQSFGALRR